MHAFRGGPNFGAPSYLRNSALSIKLEFRNSASVEPWARYPALNIKETQLVGKLVSKKNYIEIKVGDVEHRPSLCGERAETRKQIENMQSD